MLIRSHCLGVGKIWPNLADKRASNPQANLLSRAKCKENCTKNNRITTTKWWNNIASKSLSSFESSPPQRFTLNGGRSRQKSGDILYIGKRFQNQVHKPPSVLDPHKVHRNNHWNVSIQRPARRRKRFSENFVCARGTQPFSTWINGKWLEGKIIETIRLKKLL